MSEESSLILKLDKLYQTIAEKEKELDNIRRIGTLGAGVNADYVHNLRAEHLSCQREYNLILEQNPSLAKANGRNKIIIDTFKDHWLEKVDYQIGEPVEIDIDKRLQNPEKLPLYFSGKIGEDCQYDFFTLEGSFLKRDKKTSQVIYLGDGRVSCYLKRDEATNSVSIDQELVTAAVFNNWIYWYESKSIASDKFIYRRSTDGRLYEQLDWLSNEKTITSNGRSAHSVSEDKVRKMSATPLELIIEVNRITRDENYIITVKDTKGGLTINKSFPWEKSAKNDDISNGALHPPVDNTIVTTLATSPFYILDVSPTDKRATIINNSEEKSFLLDESLCEDAQTKLLNPAKRLLAELDWFLDVDKKTLRTMHNCIAENQEISTEGLSPISKINALLFNFNIMQNAEAYDIGFVLTEIDEQFGLVTIDYVMEMVNNCRKDAGMKIVTEAEIEKAIDAKRDAIRQVFTEKLHALSDKEYMDFVSILAKQYVANDDYSDGIIISDALDQYEIRMQTEIQKHTEAVEKYIDRIKGLTDETAIKENIRGLIKRVKEWDVFVQPLQLRSQASGMPHENSFLLGKAIRELALYLHNEKELTDIALDLVIAMQEVFAEVGDLAEHLEEDAEALTNIVATASVVKGFATEMDLLKSTADRMGFSTTMSDVETFISRVKSFDRDVEYSDLEDEIIEKIRISICVVAREAAIKLHNNYQKTNLALKIAKALLAQFSDIDELKARLQEDAQSLAQQSLMLERVQAAKQAQEDSARTKKIVAWILIGIVLFIILIASLSECDGSSSSSSGSSNNGGYNSSGSYYPSGGSSSSGGSSNKDNNKIVVTSSNFEDYFTITTSAEYKGNTVTISYSIKPKSTTYASKSSSSSSITLKLKGGVYPYSFSTTPTYSSTESITLYKSSGYKKTGTITIYVTSGKDEIYWGTEVTSASGTIYK